MGCSVEFNLEMEFTSLRTLSLILRCLRCVNRGRTLLDVSTRDCPLSARFRFAASST